MAKERRILVIRRKSRKEPTPDQIDGALTFHELSHAPEDFPSFEQKRRTE